MRYDYAKNLEKRINYNGSKYKKSTIAKIMVEICRGVGVSHVKQRRLKLVLESEAVWSFIAVMPVTLFRQNKSIKLIIATKYAV